MKVRPRYNEPIDQTLRRFKRMLDKDGVLREMKRAMAYEKPSEERNRARRKILRDKEKAMQELKNPHQKKTD